MNKLYSLLTSAIFSVSFLFAASGDTTTVRVYNNFSMNRYGNFDVKAKLPDASKKYQRIWLKYTLGCESNGQCEWDYTIKLHLKKPTGKIDSVMKEAPYLKVNGEAKDSIVYSSVQTWVNKFNPSTKQTDSSLSASFLISVYNDPDKPLQLTDTIRGFEADYYRYWFDTTGNKTDSTWVPSTNTIRQKRTVYYDVFNVYDNYELGRFISPYAKTFPKTFKYDYIYDVTDYVSLFNGNDSAEFRIEYQGYSYGFTATWDMIYVEGTPAREVIGIENIYNGGFDYGQATSIETRLTAKQFTVPKGTTATKARVIITGHGMDQNQNCAEFCAKKYFLKLNNGQIAEQLIWKDDCGSNAIAAQPGTWVYDRANWCPGEKVRNLDHWLTLNQESSNTIDMDIEPFVASGGASYNISMVLIHYKANGFTNDAAIEDVIAPSKNQWHNRVNPVCDNARIILKNWGSQRLTRAVIAFRISEGPVQKRYWAGDLAYEQETEVSLPYLEWPADLSNPVFKVWIEGVNSKEGDDNPLNNSFNSPFDLPSTLPSIFIVETRTNSLPQHNSFKVTDMYGKVHYTKNYSLANTLQRDTITLGYGCYTFQFDDAGGNGIGWWAAPNEGTGSVRIRQATSNTTIKQFNTDFGNFVQLNFRVSHAVGFSETIKTSADVNVYPTPAKDLLYIEGVDASNITISDLSGRDCLKSAYTESGVSIKDLPVGVYFMNITDKSGQIFIKKINVIK